MLVIHAIISFVAKAILDIRASKKQNRHLSFSVNHIVSIRNVTHVAVDLYIIHRLVVIGHGRPGNVYSNREWSTLVTTISHDSTWLNSILLICCDALMTMSDNAKNIKYTWARYAWVQHTAIFMVSWPQFFFFLFNSWNLFDKKLVWRSHDVQCVDGWFAHWHAGNSARNKASQLHKMSLDVPRCHSIGWWPILCMYTVHTTNFYFDASHVLCVINATSFSTFRAIFFAPVAPLTTPYGLLSPKYPI